MAANVRIRCEICNVEIAKRSLSRHLQTPGHIAEAKHCKLCAEGWTDQIWRNEHHVSRSTWLREGNSIHSKEEQTRYYRGGWGRNGYIHPRSYMHTSLVEMYYSPQVTDAEFQMCAALPESDPRYQALWTVVQLGLGGKSND